jgi:hypothetical protein
MKTQFVCFAVFGGLLGVLPLTYAQTGDPPSITNIPPIVTIYATDPLASESGPDTGTFTVVRNGPTNTVLAVFYTLGGTASNGVDYEKLGGSLVIPEGSFMAQLTDAD